MRRVSMLDQPWRDEEAALPAPINAVAAYQAMRDLHHLDYLDLITIRGHPRVFPDQSRPVAEKRIVDPVWYPLDLADCTLEPTARRGGVESSHDSPLERNGFERSVPR
jgi:hypothetical protein